MARSAEIQICYAIGQADPVSVYVQTFGTEINGWTPECILERVIEKFSLRPAEMIKYLKLKNPIYEQTSRYGHFGKQAVEANGLMHFPWEATVDLTKKRKRGFNVIVLGESATDSYGFKSQFRQMSDEELVESYNRGIDNSGWGSARAVFLNNLYYEMKARDWDISLIKTEHGFSMTVEICLVEGKVEFLQ